MSHRTSVILVNPVGGSVTPPNLSIASVDLASMPAIASLLEARIVDIGWLRHGPILLIGRVFDERSVTLPAANFRCCRNHDAINLRGRTIIIDVSQVTANLTTTNGGKLLADGALDFDTQDLSDIANFLHAEISPGGLELQPLSSGLIDAVTGDVNEGPAPLQTLQSLLDNLRSGGKSLGVKEILPDGTVRDSSFAELESILRGDASGSPRAQPKESADAALDLHAEIPFRLGTFPCALDMLGSMLVKWQEALAEAIATGIIDTALVHQHNEFSNALFDHIAVFLEANKLAYDELTVGDMSADEVLTWVKEEQKRSGGLGRSVN